METSFGFFWYFFVIHTGCTFTPHRLFFFFVYLTPLPSLHSSLPRVIFFVSKKKVVLLPFGFVEHTRPFRTHKDQFQRDTMNSDELETSNSEEEIEGPCRRTRSSRNRVQSLRTGSSLSFLFDFRCFVLACLAFH